MAARTRSQRVIIAAVVAGALIAGMGAVSGLGPVEWIYDHSVVPAGRGLGAAGSSLGTFFDTLGKVRGLSAENARLQTENADLRGRLAASADAARENIDLRRELGLRTAEAGQQIGADVVAYQPDSYRQFVTLDRGSSSGVKVGQAALNNGVVVGVISAVNASTSKLQLIIDPAFALAVQDQETGAGGVAHGQLGGGLSVEQLAQTDTVSPGDTVATSGLGGTVPRGLLIGQIQSVNAGTDGIFKTAHVNPDLKANQLRYVFVVTGQ